MVIRMRAYKYMPELGFIELAHNDQSGWMDGDPGATFLGLVNVWFI